MAITPPVLSQEEEDKGKGGLQGLRMRRSSWLSSRSTAGSLESRDKGGTKPFDAMSGRACPGHGGHWHGLVAIGLQMAWDKN